MLWYKSWLETRYRLLFLVLLFGMIASMQYNTVLSRQSTAAKAGVLPMSVGLTTFTAFSTLLTFMMMGGAGITTQTMRGRRGIHSSMLYTLALPVTRLRMMAVRVGMGWAESVAIIAVLCGMLWMAYPQFRAVGSTLEMLEHIATLLACGTVLYSLSVLLATFLDDQMRAFGTMFGFLGIWWFSVRGKLPSVIDLFAAMGRKSPLIVHVMPWTTIGIAVCLSAVFLLAALRVARAREY